MVTLGAMFATSVSVVMLRSSRVCAVTDVMAIGTICKFSLRNCAVTTISSRPSLPLDVTVVDAVLAACGLVSADAGPDAVASATQAAIAA